MVFFSLKTESPDGYFFKAYEIKSLFFVNKYLKKFLAALWKKKVYSLLLWKLLLVLKIVPKAVSEFVFRLSFAISGLFSPVS